MNLRTCVAVLACLAISTAALAVSPKGVTRVYDRAAFVKQLKQKGYTAKGGISKGRTDANSASGDTDGNGKDKSFPHFTSSFSFHGKTYPYTMVGYAPASGKSTNVRSVIVPLRMNFTYFADSPIVFDPMPAVTNIVNSPMYNDAVFPNGIGQFGDMLQRATFWNRLDSKRKWHVTMNKPRVLDPIDILVEPDVGEAFDVIGDGTGLLGNVRFGFMDATIHTILPFLDLQPDELPIFVTGNVSADALGYHDAYAVDAPGKGSVLQTLIYTSWLDINIVGDLLADVSTFNHELAEWLNDPYVNNIAPTWEYPPFNVVCSDNPFLEVGDPQGNGPDYAQFPTVPVAVNGTTYHLQDVVMLPWFAGESPSTAQNGWYDFPSTHQITSPAVPCP